MESLAIGLPTLVVILVYLAGINVAGAWLGRGQKDAKDYFLGSHAMPWVAVMASIVATETSALTFLSVPGDATKTSFTFLQLGFGYLIGRIGVSLLLLPSYFRGDFPTAYALLEKRFGTTTRRATSVMFMVTRILAASVRLAVPAIPIALILKVPVSVAILILAGATALYTFVGGIKAVIWIDLVQVVIYLSGATFAMWTLVHLLPGGLPGIFRLAASAGHPVQLFDLTLSLAKPYTLWAGLLGGAFLAMASHGADQLIVQRLLACKGLRDAQKALVGSGVLIIVQFSLFLLIGVSLTAFYSVHPATFAGTDEIFPTFIVTRLPPFLSAYLVAGIFSAAMCSESSALNSLASALTHDILAPLLGKEKLDGRVGLWTGRALTLVWTVVLALLAIGFSRTARDQAGVQIALGLASVTAGGLLGAFLVGLYVKKARQADVLVAIGASTSFIFALWLGSKGWIQFPLATRIAWPWYSLVGSLLTLGIGWAASRRHAS